MPKATNLRTFPNKISVYSKPAQATKSTTPAPVKYEIHPFDRAKILSKEIDPTLVNPYKYTEFPRNASGQLTIDLNTDVEFNRYMINLQISKFEDVKFNEVVDIEFEEFLPEPEPEFIPTRPRIADFIRNAASNAIQDTTKYQLDPATQKVTIKR